MAKNTNKSAPVTERRKKFPIRCIKCGQTVVCPATIAYEIEKNHDGKLHKLRIPELRVNRCGNCGHVYFSNDADEQISAALRTHLGLLAPEDIRRGLGSLNLSQKDAAELLGIAPKTMSRWLTGAMIQSRAMDKLMRVFFAVPEARNVLSGERMSASAPAGSLVVHLVHTSGSGPPNPPAGASVDPDSIRWVLSSLFHGQRREEDERLIDAILSPYRRRRDLGRGFLHTVRTFWRLAVAPVEQDASQQQLFSEKPFSRRSEALSLYQQLFDNLLRTSEERRVQALRHVVGILDLHEERKERFQQRLD